MLNVMGLAQGWGKQLSNGRITVVLDGGLVQNARFCATENRYVPFPCYSNAVLLASARRVVFVTILLVIMS